MEQRHQRRCSLSDFYIPTPASISIIATHGFSRHSCRSCMTPVERRQPDAANSISAHRHQRRALRRLHFHRTMISAPTQFRQPGIDHAGPHVEHHRSSVCPPTSIVGSAARRIPNLAGVSRTARGWQYGCRRGAASAHFHIRTLIHPEAVTYERARSFANYPIGPAAAEQRPGQAAWCSIATPRPPPPGLRRRTARSSPTHGSA